MMCLGCGRVLADIRDGLCEWCRIDARETPERVVPGVGVVVSAYRHAGPPRRLVHHLKYRAVAPAAMILARQMAPKLDRWDVSPVLVPVPRLGWRRIRYGVDPALELARSLAAITGLSVWSGLAAPFWGRSRAGRQHGSAPEFRLRPSRPVPGPVVLVDDVVTSGATLRSAAAVLDGVIGGCTATGAGGRHTGTNPDWAPVFDPGKIRGREVSR